MSQLQIFTASDHLLKYNCFYKNRLQNRKIKLGKNYLILLKEENYNPWDLHLFGSGP